MAHRGEGCGTCLERELAEDAFDAQQLQSLLGDRRAKLIAKVVHLVGVATRIEKGRDADETPVRVRF